MAAPFAYPIQQNKVPKQRFLYGQSPEFDTIFRGRMISAPTRAPENLSPIRINGFRITVYFAGADVGADIIRPLQQCLHEKKELFTLEKLLV